MSAKLSREEREAIYTKLLLPFEPWEVKKSRVIRGEQFDTVPADAVANRLDDVLGPGNWWAKYREDRGTCTRCRLFIRLPDGTIEMKEDCGGTSESPDEGDGIKASYSDAFKRAARMHGVARYIWGMGVPKFARHAFNTEIGRICREYGLVFPADLPQEYRVAPTATQGPALQLPEPTAPKTLPNGKPVGSKPPILKSDFAAWLKAEGEKIDFGLAAYISDWSKTKRYPARITEWSQAQFDLAISEAQRKIAFLTNKAKRATA